MPATNLTTNTTNQALAREIYRRLRMLYPDAHCELDHRAPFELLVATVLSAQTTDVLVNQVTPKLFARFPDARALAKADVADVSAVLRERLGMFNQKGKNIVGLAKKIVEKHGGLVPKTLRELIDLPGVGRKTANVVLGVAFGMPEGVVVDTHVQRLSQRLGFTTQNKPERIEQELSALFPPEDWNLLSLTLIFHGRRICFARKPACASCGINDLCPSAFHADHVGRKPPKKRRLPSLPSTAAHTPKKGTLKKGTLKKAPSAQNATRSASRVAKKATTIR